MAYSAEFKKQWKKVCDYLESEMIRSSKQSGTIQVSHISALLNNEKKRWQVMGEYNYAWLEKLRREKPEVAAQFESALLSINLSQEKPSDNPSVILAGVPGVAGALVGFGVPALLKWGLKWTLIGCVGLTAIAGYVGVSLYKKKKDDLAATDRKLYVCQLEAAGDKLTAILTKAD